jgi:hypothetical protein
LKEKKLGVSLIADPFAHRRKRTVNNLPSEIALLALQLKLLAAITNG